MAIFSDLGQKNYMAAGQSSAIPQVPPQAGAIPQLRARLESVLERLNAVNQETGAMLERFRGPQPSPTNTASGGDPARQVSQAEMLTRIIQSMEEAVSTSERHSSEIATFS